MYEIFYGGNKTNEPWLVFMAFNVFGVQYNDASFKKFLEWLSMHYEKLFSSEDSKGHEYFDQIILVLNILQKKNMKVTHDRNRIYQIDNDIAVLEKTKVSIARTYLEGIYPELTGSELSKYIATCLVALIDQYGFRTKQIMDVIMDMLARDFFNTEIAASKTIDLIASRIVYCEVVNAMDEKEKLLVEKIRGREVLSGLNHYFPVSQSALDFIKAGNRQIERFKKILGSIESSGTEVGIHYLSPENFVSSKFYAEIARKRKAIFDLYNWQHQTPPDIKQNFEADYRDLISNHIVITLNGNAVAFARLCYPEETNSKPTREWFDGQGFLVNGPISEGFSTEHNGHDIDNLDMYLNDDFAANLINQAALEGTLFEAQRFLIDFDTLKRVYAENDELQGNIKELYLTLFVSNILLSAFAGLSLKTNAQIAFDQADPDFSKLLKNTLGEASEGGGFYNVGESYTTNHDGTRSKTLFNIIMPIQGRIHASQEGGRSQAEAILAQLISGSFDNSPEKVTQEQQLILQTLLHIEA